MAESTSTRGAFTFKLRRDTALRWESRNTLLQDGEPGYEKDTHRMKVGDGSTLWNDLQYLSAESQAEFDFEDALNATMQAHVNSQSPHPVYDDGPDLSLLYQNAKV